MTNLRTGLAISLVVLFGVLKRVMSWSILGNLRLGCLRKNVLGLRITRSEIGFAATLFRLITKDAGQKLSFPAVTPTLCADSSNQKSQRFLIVLSSFALSLGKLGIAQRLRFTLTMIKSIPLGLALVFVVRALRTSCVS